MRSAKTNNERLSIEGRWDDLSAFERLKMIREHLDHFLSFGLVTPEEGIKVQASAESDLEYIVERASDRIFHNINLQDTFDTQPHRQQIKTALKAVFL